MNKAVFIDKDGTLIKDVPYNVNPRLVEFMPIALESLKAFKEKGFLLIMVTNQSGVAHNYFSISELQELLDFINIESGRCGASFDRIYMCPHAADKLPACNCRKPLPGMLLRAKEEFNIDMEASWMIGDILHDVEAGNRAGCKTILLDVGNETEWQNGNYRTPDYTVKNWQQISETILPGVSPPVGTAGQTVMQLISANPNGSSSASGTAQTGSPPVGTAGQTGKQDASINHISSSLQKEDQNSSSCWNTPHHSQANNTFCSTESGT